MFFGCNFPIECYFLILLDILCFLFVCLLNVLTIPDICHFFYTGKIFRDKILHPKARKLRQIGFRDKMHKSWFIGTNTNCRSRSVGGHNNVFDILKNTRCQITNRE